MRFWDKLESSTKIISAIAIPVVIAIGGWWIQNSITRQSISKDYVTLTIGVLEKPKADIDQSLREWAVDLLAEYAPTKFPTGTITRLKSGSINLGTLSSILSSKTGNRIAIAPDGRTIAVGGRDVVIRIIELTTGRVLYQLKGHTDMVTSVSFTPDGQRLFSGSLDNTAREWDIATGKSISVIPLTQAVYDVVISADGAQLVIGLADDTVMIFSEKSHQLLTTLNLQ